MGKPQIKRGRGRPMKAQTRNRKANVTSSDVVEWVKLRGDGWTMQAIADKYDRSKHVVIKYVKGGKVVKCGRKSIMSDKQKTSWCSKVVSDGEKCVRKGLKYVSLMETRSKWKFKGDNRKGKFKGKKPSKSTCKRVLKERKVSTMRP